MVMIVAPQHRVDLVSSHVLGDSERHEVFASEHPDQHAVLVYDAHVAHA